MSTRTQVDQLSKLRSQWLAYALLGFLTIFVLFQILTESHSVANTIQWVIQALLIMTIQLFSLWRALPKNRRPGEQEVLPRFGPGNWMSLMRGTIIALLTGFLFQAKISGFWAWVPAILYLISDFTDVLDGYLARISNTVTQLGKTLDMNNDALGVLVATALAFQFGNVPWWYLPFGFARYLFLLGLYLRRRKSLPEYALQPNNTRRLFAGLQMGFITVMLIPTLNAAFTTYAATLFLIPFMAIFILDYWQVTGLWERFAFWSQWNKKLLGKIFSEWLPLALRILAVVILLFPILSFGGLLSPKFSAASTANPGIFTGLNVVFLLLLALGTLNRVAAIGALISIGFQSQWLSFNLEYALLILALIYIIFVGGGKFSLWNPEEWLIHNRPGQKNVPGR